MSAPKPPSGWSVRSKLPAVAALLGTACVVPHEKIEGEDRATLLPAARLSLDLLPARPPAAPPAAGEPTVPPRKEFRLLLDVEASHGRGEFTQHVLAPNVISLGGTGFTGDVDVDFSLFRGSVSVRAASRFASGIGLDGFLGIGMSDLDIELSQAGVSDSESTTSFGPLVGARLSMRTIEQVRLFVEGSLNYGLASGYDGVGVRLLDVGADVELGRNARLTAGWRQIVYEAEADDFAASDIELELSGPLVRIWVFL